MIYALITIYNPQEQVPENIATVAKQVDKIFLCDNSSKNNKVLFDNISNAEYIFFAENKGLSGAFNTILKQNLFDDEDFIVFFDQDSNIQDGHITKLTEDYISLEQRGFSVGCVGPVYYNTSSNSIEIPKQKKKVLNNCYEVKSIITSSMLCKYKTLKLIDYWNENIFLDMADWDLCWRLIDKKQLCYMTKSTVLNHSLGNGEKKVLFFKLRVGSPFREYYQTRDCLHLLKEDYIPFKFRLRFLLMLTIRPILHYLFLDKKNDRMYYIKKGKKDFKKNIKGSL